jgi:glutathione synthase/RimK-type ligase-like ATP-grasp enzyme
MKTVALVTYRNSSKLTRDDQLLVEPLKKYELNPVSAAWDDAKIDWSKFDCIILRSCWNYHLKYEQFMEWLDRIEKLKVSVWNPIHIIRWNSNKKYLKDLERKGIPIVPTVFLEKEEKYYLADIAKHKKWKDLVIKPAVGASSYNVTLITQNEYKEKQKEVEKLSQQSGILIQPYMKEISGGEYSFIFIGKQFSHSVLKIPKKGDFRSNYEMGAKENKIEADKNTIQQAANVIEAVNSPLLYARVDGIVQDDMLLLTELELIEPYLYFDLDSLAPARFAKALQSNTHFIGI